MRVARAAYLVATADTGTAGQVVVAEGGRRWQVDSDVRNVVFGRVAMEALESGTSTDGSLQARRSAAPETESEAAAGVHGSQACCQGCQPGALRRENTAGHDGQPPGFETGAAEMDTGRAQHAMGSAAAWRPCYGSPLSPTESDARAMEAHIAVSSAAMGTARREGRLRWLEGGIAESETASAQWARSSAQAWLQARRWLC